MTQTADPDRYEETLAPLLDARARRACRPSVRRLALRFAYGLFFRVGIDFPLVRMRTPRDSELAYHSLEELRARP